MKKKLKEICSKIHRGKTPKYIDSSDVLVFAQKCNLQTGGIDLNKCLCLDTKNIQKWKKDDYLFREDILINSTGIGTLGRVGYFDTFSEKPVVPDTHVTVVRVSDSNVHSKWVYYCLKNKQDFLISKGHGSTKQQELATSEIEKIEIPCPDLLFQKRSVKFLDTIQSAIDNKKQQLSLLDEAVKSEFVEMFGNKNFPIQKWDSIFITKTGKLDSNAMVEGGKYPFFTCAKEIFSIDNYAFDQEALLLAGNNAAGKYDVKYYKGKFNAYQRTYVLSLKEDWSYRLFQFQLEDKLLYLKEQSKGINTKFLTLKILQELEFIIPPKELQLKFETFVQQIDKSKFVVKQQITDLQELLDSKMQEYFA